MEKAGIYYNSGHPFKALATPASCSGSIYYGEIKGVIDYAKGNKDNSDGWIGAFYSGADDYLHVEFITIGLIDADDFLQGHLSNVVANGGAELAAGRFMAPVSQAVYIPAASNFVLDKNERYSIYDNQSPKTGNDWSDYLKNQYGKENIQWKLNSIDDIIEDPTRMVGYSENEMATVLGDGWTRGVYGSKGDGWKFAKGDISVFYHPSGGIHGGAYYGISSGAFGKIKVVDPSTYISFPDDNATIIYY